MVVFKSGPSSNSGASLRSANVFFIGFESEGAALPSGAFVLLQSGVSNPWSVLSTQPSPRTAIPASKADLRNNLATAKSEIETLQTDLSGIFRLTVSNENAATVVAEDPDERKYLVLESGVTSLEIPDSLALGVVLNGVNESGGTVTIVAESGGSTVFAGSTAIPNDKPFSAIKTGPLKVRLIVGG